MSEGDQTSRAASLVSADYVGSRVRCCGQSLEQDQAIAAHTHAHTHTHTHTHAQTHTPEERCGTHAQVYVKNGRVAASRSLY